MKKYAQLMLSLVNKGKRADILQFTLVMLADLLNGSAPRLDVYV
jgi:hypothetical protein